MTAPRLVVEDVAFFERHVPFRTPFRFGVATLTEAPQIFVRARIRFHDGRIETGQAAEMLAPKWFDKTLSLTNEQNFDQLRLSLSLARGLVLDAADRPETAFGLHAAIAPAQYAACAAQDLNRLIASFGTALIDRAILDALCRAKGASLFGTARANLMGMDAATTPDLAGFDLDAYLATLRPAPSIEARHTVGMIDPIRDADIAPEARLNDGLPESLEAVIATYGQRAFKLKLGGDSDADIDRLCCIAGVLDDLPEPYRISLDGNEQYANAEAVLSLVERIAAVPALERLFASVLYIEQPINRAQALDRSVDALAQVRPVVLDESDADIDAFPRARALGYRGISSKACKGVYRSLLNSARAVHWNAAAPGAPYFMTAEDLTTQPGIALQQDLALATLIGCHHVERNGHHYVDGMAGAPADEQARFAAAHPDLYDFDAGRVRLRIAQGRIALGSLDCAGFGTTVRPDWDEMKPGGTR